MMKKPIKVLQIVPLGTGGITSLVLNIAENLNNDEVTFDYMTFRNQKEINEDRALSYGGKKVVVPIDKYHNKFVRGIYKYFGTIKILKEEEIDILHINASFPYDIIVGISAKKAGVKKVVFHSHNSNMKEDKTIRGKIMPYCKKLIQKVSDYNIACSELAAQFMFPNEILESGNYSILKNGIILEQYGFSETVRDEYRKKLNVDDKVVVGHIGRFTKQKNHVRLIEIFSEFHKIEPNSVLVLIGIGELEDEIKELVVEKKLCENVIFYGATSEVPKLLQAFDLFLFPSLFEGLPVVGVEVQATGLPILMSDVITKEVSITNLAHYMSLNESSQEWANELKRIYDGRMSRRDYKAEVKEAGFDISDVTKELCDIYKRIINVD